MSGTGSQQEDTRGSWATETLPMAVRKELLERELSQRGARKSPPTPDASAGSGSSHSPAPDGEHPQASEA